MIVIIIEIVTDNKENVQSVDHKRDDSEIHEDY